MISQAPTQPADALAVHGFREYRLRIEPGDEGFRADRVGDESGGDADRAVGAEGDTQSEQRNEYRQDQAARDQLSQHADSLARSAPKIRRAGSDYRPGFSCGWRHRAPTPAAG